MSWMDAVLTELREQWLVLAIMGSVIALPRYSFPPSLQAPVWGLIDPEIIASLSTYYC